MFQFPSNGKADPKKHTWLTPTHKCDNVFQFPSNGKADPKHLYRQTESHSAD